MQFVGQFWWLWLVLFLLSTGYCLFNQVQRMNRMMDGDANISRGMTGFAIAMFVSLCASIMLVLSVIWYVIQMLKT